MFPSILIYYFQGSQIVVFPEYGLTGAFNNIEWNLPTYSTIVPEPSAAVVPCTDTTNFSKVGIVELQWSNRWKIYEGIATILDSNYDQIML